MKKFLPLFCLLTFVFANTGTAQPPCLPTNGGIPAGNDAPGCTLCGPIYQGSTMGYGPSAPGSNGFPCGTIENNQFITIVADSTGTLSATILASNCQNNQGVQLIIYDQSFNPVSNCFSTGGVNTPGNVVANGLTPGQIYWIMIDGFAGDICDILITASGGINTGPPDPPGPMMIDPDTSPLCPGAVVCYEIDRVSGASDYEWIIPGNAIIVSGGGPTDNRVCVEYTAAGGGVVRVTPSNPCFPGIPAITPVVVLPILPTLIPPEFICVSDFPIVRDGNVFTSAGSHEVTYKTALGCDSVVTYVFLPNIQVPNVIDTIICQGDCIQVGNTCYDQVGGQTIEMGAPFAQANGCDSIVILSIQVFEPAANILPPMQIGCDPGDVVDLDGTSSSSGANVTYAWTALNGGVVTGSTTANFTQAGAPGTYILAVSQTNPAGLACIARDTVEVTQQVVIIDTPTFTAAETDVCTGSTHTYTIAPAAGAVNYSWTVPAGATITGANNGTSITVMFGPDAGGGTVCVTALGNCGDSSPSCIPVTINPVPTSDFTASTPICITDASTITYTGTASAFANYTWNFNGGTPAAVTGAGPHMISWDSPGPKNVTLTVEENGCTSTQTVQIVQVDAELAVPVISCDPDLTSVSFSWNPIAGATDYTVTTNPGGTTTQAGTTIDVTGLAQGDNVTITVVANGTTACGTTTASSDCTAQSCPMVDLNIAAVADICRDAATSSVTLTAAPTGGTGGGTFAWSGPGVSGDQFDPQNGTVGVNVIALEYTEGTCTYTGTVEIVVNNVPDPSFTVSGPICEDEPTTVTYTGSASSIANYMWDFGSGTVVTGTGSGPYTVDFNGFPGNQMITLTVEENGCTSPQSSEMVQVDSPLPDPVISCGPATSTTVTIEWDAVPGATSYTVNPPIGTIDMANRSIFVDGLSPGDEVTVEIVAEGNTVCGNSSATITCEPTDCPPVTVNVDPVGPFCKDGSASIVNLTAATVGAVGGGTFTWSGPGVSVPDIFDPNSGSVNAGTLTVRVSYQEGICTYTGSTDIEILPQPTSDFTVVSPICIDATSTVIYTGDAVPSATYDWDFGTNTTGQTGAGTSADPYEVGWNMGGLQDITLTVVQDNCVSMPTTLQVQVDEPMVPPVINCTSNQNNINFTWGAVDGASSHDAVVSNSTVAGGLPTNPQTSQLAWDFGGLAPGDMIEITVTASGPTVCGPVSSTFECIAQDCKDYFVVMPSLDTCLVASLAPFDLLDELAVTNTVGESLLDSINMLWGAPDVTHTYLTAGGMFFPAQAVNDFGTGDVPISLEIEYPRGSGCFQTYTSVIRLKPLPNNSILMDPNICVTDEATALLGNALNDPDAILDWDFGAGTAISGSAGGPYQINWPASLAGTSQTISVVITEEGCVAPPFEQTIILDAELPALLVECDPPNTDNQQISFIWNDLVDGDMIDVQVVGSNVSPLPAIANQTNTSALITGLSPLDEVTLTVTIDNTLTACPPVTSTATCTAVSCPDMRFVIDPVLDTCLLVSGTNPIQLTTTNVGDTDDGLGIFSWDGDDVNAVGVFEPVSGQMTYNANMTYVNGPCTYNATLPIRMYQTPTADFTVDPVICETDLAGIQYTGSAELGAVFNWTVDNAGTFGNMLDPRDPQTVSWSADGLQNILLEVNNEGCIAAPVNQQVQVDPELDPLVISCGANSTTSVEFNWNDDALVDEYEISYIFDGNVNNLPNQSGTTLSLDNLRLDAANAVQITITTVSQTACPELVETFTCNKQGCPTIPIGIDPMGPFCIDGDVGFLIAIPDFASVPAGWGNGDYTYSGNGLSDVGVFDPAQAGLGTHTLTVEYFENSCSYSNAIDVLVNDLPDVEAGATQVLSCNDLEVTIGSDVNSNAYIFDWVDPNGSSFSIDELTTVSTGGTYTLNVTNPATGCMNSDDVLVDDSFSNPEIDAEINQISCFGRQDGVISINGMMGGVAPFEYSFNGGDFGTTTFFSNLGPGSYTIVGKDANGCISEITFEVIEPDELTVEIVITAGENPVPFGDSINLEAITNYAPDLLSSIDWSPTESFPICDETNITNCLSYWVTPQGQTVYSVRVENLNGCAAEDVIPVVGIKDHPVYIPSGFSPNDGNGMNDFFGLYADPKVVTNIKTFLIFDRWGETIYENYDVPPTLGTEIAPENGWDGTFRTKKMNSGVYVYLFEVEFFDGLTEIFKGDITIK